jgi:general L-amino acid transport system substrate-binding protein
VLVNPLQALHPNANAPGDDLGKFMGLDKEWSYRIVKQVGNYGESFDRNLGANSKINLPRGRMNLWTKGGLMMSPPLR